MMVLKRFLNDDSKNVPTWWYQKGSTVMVLKKFHIDGTKKVTT